MRTKAKGPCCPSCGCEFSDDQTKVIWATRNAKRMSPARAEANRQRAINRWKKVRENAGTE